MAERRVKWEYKVVLFTDEGTLNKLGDQGWEVVCPAGKEGNYLILKRSEAGARRSTVVSPPEEKPLSSSSKEGEPPARKKPSFGKLI